MANIPPITPVAIYGVAYNIFYNHLKLSFKTMAYAASFFSGRNREEGWRYVIWSRWRKNKFYTNSNSNPDNGK